MLFVNDGQRQRSESHIRADDGMRPNQNVQLACLERSQHLPSVFGARLRAHAWLTTSNQIDSSATTSNFSTMVKHLVKCRTSSLQHVPTT